MTDQPPNPEPQQPIAGSGNGAEVWAIIVRTLPDSVPGSIRMRRWLKLALRSYGLKVESVGERLPVAQASPPAAPAKRPRKPRPKPPRPPDDLVGFVESELA